MRLGVFTGEAGADNDITVRARNLRVQTQTFNEFNRSPVRAGGRPKATSLHPGATQSLLSRAPQARPRPAAIFVARRCGFATGPSDEAADLFRRTHEVAEQRMRREGLRLQLGVELHADEPGVV